MTQRDDFQQRVTSIENLVNRLEGSTDPSVTSAARDLMKAVMDLHGSSIERMLEIIHDSGEPGKSIIESLGRDELVQSILLLYGLHPRDMHTRVADALDSQRAFLRSHGASAEVVSIDEAGVVTVRLQSKPGGCGSTATSVKSTIKAAIQEAAPDAGSIVVEEPSSTVLTAPNFVSVAVLLGSQAKAAVSAQRDQRSGV